METPPIIAHTILIVDEEGEIAAICPACRTHDPQDSDGIKLDLKYNTLPHLICNSCNNGGAFVLCPECIYYGKNKQLVIDPGCAIAKGQLLPDEWDFAGSREQTATMYKIPLAKVVGVCNTWLYKFYRPSRPDIKPETLARIIADLAAVENSGDGAISACMKRHKLIFRENIKHQRTTETHERIRPNPGVNGMDDFQTADFITAAVDSYNIFHPRVPYPAGFNTRLDDVLLTKCISSRGKSFRTLLWGD